MTNGVDGGSPDPDVELIGAFSNYQEGRGFSPKTIKRRRETLDALRRLVAPSRLVDVTTDDLEEWLRTKPSPRTRHAYRSDLRAFFGWAKRRKLVDDDPTELLDPIKVPKSLPRPLGDKAHLMMLTGSLRARQMVALGLYAGLRVAEIADLDGTDVMPEASPPVIVVRNGKGSKDRIVPMHPVLRTVLADIPKAGPVFVGRHGRAILPASVSQVIRRQMEICGIEGTPHQLRHTFGTSLAKLSEGNVMLVASTMGHESPKTTMGYIAWDNSGAADLVARLYADQHPTGIDDGDVIPFRRSA